MWYDVAGNCVNTSISEAYIRKPKNCRDLFDNYKKVQKTIRPIVRQTAGQKDRRCAAGDNKQMHRSILRYVLTR